MQTQWILSHALIIGLPVMSCFYQMK